MLEVEVKVKIDHSEVKKVLENLGFLKKSSVYERDVYYNGTCVDLKKEDKALRIREHRDLDSGETICQLNFKGPKMDSITMTREETEFEIPGFVQGERLLHGLGYHAAGGVEKTRIQYEKGEISCCLDQVTGLGEFLEIEILTENETGYEEAIGKIEKLLSCLGLRIEDTIRTSYLSMLERWE